MKTLVIRADADRRIGTGHVMRCLALAQEWTSRGGKVRFVTRCTHPPLLERIAQAPAEIVPLPKTALDPLSDARLTIACCHAAGAGWAVIDGYQFDAKYHATLRQADVRVLVVDDYCHLPQYEADILLNPNLGAERLSYLRTGRTRYLLGTPYAMLRTEFVRRSTWQRTPRPHGSRLLVTMGGSDPDNTAGKVIEALRLRPFPELQTRVVLGPSYQGPLDAAARPLPPSVELLRNVSDMPELMAWADLAVAAAGSTCWELALMALPALLVVLADNQAGIATALDAAGCAQNLGNHRALQSARIAYALQALILDTARCHHMSGIGRKLVDGQGRIRVADALLGEGT